MFLPSDSLPIIKTQKVTTSVLFLLTVASVRSRFFVSLQNDPLPILMIIYVNLEFKFEYLRSDRDVQPLKSHSLMLEVHIVSCGNVPYLSQSRLLTNFIT